MSANRTTFIQQTMSLPPLAPKGGTEDKDKGSSDVAAATTTLSGRRRVRRARDRQPLPEISGEGESLSEGGNAEESVAVDESSRRRARMNRRKAKTTENQDSEPDPSANEATGEELEESETGEVKRAVRTGRRARRAKAAAAAEVAVENEMDKEERERSEPEMATNENEEENETVQASTRRKARGRRARARRTEHDEGEGDEESGESGAKIGEDEIDDDILGTSRSGRSAGTTGTAGSRTRRLRKKRTVKKKKESVHDGDGDDDSDDDDTRPAYSLEEPAPGVDLAAEDIVDDFDKERGHGGGDGDGDGEHENENDDENNENQNTHASPTPRSKKQVAKRVEVRHQPSSEVRVVYVEGVEGSFRGMSGNSRGPGGIGTSLANLSGIHAVPAAPERKSVSEDERLAAFVDSIWRMFGRVAFYFQGCLAGISLYFLYATYIIFGGQPEFLSYYAAIASDSQNAIRVLIGVSLVASIDKVFLYIRSSKVTRKQRLVAIVTASLYFVAFVVNIALIPADQGLDNMAKTINFSSATTIPSPFPEIFPGYNLVIWHVLNFIRLLLSSVTFMLVCYGVPGQMITADVDVAATSLNTARSSRSARNNDVVAFA